MNSSKQKISREFSAGGTVYKIARSAPLWLIAKSAPSPEYPVPVWRLQKGWLDDIKNGDEPGKLASGKTKATEAEIRKAALREVQEEGGIEAKIIKKLATERYFYTNSKGIRIMKFVTFYLMEYLSEVENGFGSETSEIAWLPYDKARKMLTHSGEKKILDKANSLLASGLQENLI